MVQDSMCFMDFIVWLVWPEETLTDSDTNQIRIISEWPFVETTIQRSVCMASYTTVSNSFPGEWSLGLTYDSVHCIDHLRQTLMCAGSTTIIPTSWRPGISQQYVDAAQVQTCRDFNRIRQFTWDRYNGTLVIPRPKPWYALAYCLRQEQHISTGVLLDLFFLSWFLINNGLSRTLRYINRLSHILTSPPRSYAIIQTATP